MTLRPVCSVSSFTNDASHPWSVTLAPSTTPSRDPSFLLLSPVCPVGRCSELLGKGGYQDQQGTYSALCWEVTVAPALSSHSCPLQSTQSPGAEGNRSVPFTS